MSVEPGSAVRCVWVTHTERLSGRMPRPAGCPIQRSSLHCRQARRLRWLTSLPMTWALRRTPSGPPAHASQPTTLPELGPKNGSGSGCTYLPLSVNSFSTTNNAGAPSAGTSSTTDLTLPPIRSLPRCAGRDSAALRAGRDSAAVIDGLLKSRGTGFARAEKRTFGCLAVTTRTHPRHTGQFDKSRPRSSCRHGYGFPGPCSPLASCPPARRGR